MGLSVSSFWGGGVPCSASCGVCESGIVRFAGASNCVASFGAHSPWFVLLHSVSFLVLQSRWLRLLSVLK